MAGGTDLLVQMRGGRTKPKVVIDLKKIPALTGIREEAGGFVIGAATSGAALGEHAALKAAWPGLVEAANLIGSTQVQGRASLGGNLCNASPAADSVPALIAAGAVCIVEGPGGVREVPVEQVQAGPGKTTLAADEILVAFRLPARPARSGDAYLRLIPRTEMDIAVVGAGVSLTLDASGACTAARVGVGAVAPTCLLVEAAGAALVGTKLDDAALTKLEAAVADACKPISVQADQR
jgi:carbon-monoxide dehydrogenase medium subunit